MSTPISLLVLPMLPSVRAADYTGDGIDDLVVGVPYEDTGGASATGGVEVIRGSTSGLSSRGDAFVDQDTTGVPSTNEDDEWFGYALAAGDVDDDGTDDLIVGGVYEGVGGIAAAGAIWRLELTPGSGTLSVTTAQLFSQDTSGITGTPELEDWFGDTVVVADFDGDGYDDVVVGIPGEDVGTIVDAGGISFIPGGPTGLTATGQFYYDQNVTDVSGTAETGDRFGDTLAAGDFDDDGYADLAIGVPDEDWSGVDEGAAQVMYGTSSGPGVGSPDDELWSAGSPSSVAGTLQDGNQCGSALAVGDFDADGYDDLSIGCVGYDVRSAAAAGAVLVLDGSATGLDASEIWSQDSTGVAGMAEDGDYFGSALTSGDYDDDGYDDLAIGVRESSSIYTDNGGVQVLPGSSGGLTSVGSLVLSQDVGSIVHGTPADYDDFGWALASGDWNDDGLDDLAIGSVGDDDSGVLNAGVVNVFYGSTSGPSTSGDQIIHQDTPGIDDASEVGDWFGFSLR
jgi:hypothetical protein